MIRHLRQRFAEWRAKRAIRKGAPMLQEIQAAFAAPGGLQIASYSVELYEEDEEPEAPANDLPPGRQLIQMPGQPNPFGMSRPWSRPVPAGAQSAPWEDVHRFIPGGKPKRDAYVGLHGGEPPIAFVCVGCELEQTPMHASEERACPYCGLKLKQFGTRVFWWREAGPAVAEWRP